MTDRYNYLIVALEQDIRSDDAENLILCIQTLKGVLAVTPNVVDGTGWTAEARVRLDVQRKLWNLFKT